jgi:hypothetical protein
MNFNWPARPKTLPSWAHDLAQTKPRKKHFVPKNFRATELPRSSGRSGGAPKPRIRVKAISRRVT